jgi:predicted transcriptional regulator
MLTRSKLADLLKKVNVREVADEANVSTKTIYRLRHQETAPSVDVAERLALAVERIKRRTRKKPTKTDADKPIEVA